MRHFRCVVGNKEIKFHEIYTEITVADAKATVDGIIFIYKIVRHKNVSVVNKNWRERGTMAVFEHARELGDLITWIRTPRETSKKDNPNDKQFKLPF